MCDKRLVIWLWLLVVLSGLTGCRLWTVRPIGWKEKKTAVATQAFDAAGYVDSIWASKVAPAVTGKAVELATLLAALEADADAAKTLYGVREGDGPVHFVVKGEGVVARVDSASPHRTLAIRLSKYTGKTEVSMQIGPVFRGTALRDAVGFIRFNEFVNQLQYAEVSTKLHDRVFATVVPALDAAAAPGKSLSFYGVFTLNERGTIMLTPVKLAVGGKEGGKD